MGIIVPTGKSGIFGDKKKHKRACVVLPILVLRAQEPNTITFRELGNAIGFRRYDLFGDILDCINTELYWINEEIPTLSTIVVRVVNNERMPSNWMGKQMGKQLNSVEVQRGFPTRRVFVLLSHRNPENVCL